MSKKYLLSVICVAILLPALVLAAQEPPPDAPSTDKTTNSIAQDAPKGKVNKKKPGKGGAHLPLANYQQEVVVSATRSEESQRDLPVSTTVITSTQIQQTPVFTVDDLLRSVPGINLPANNSDLLYPTHNTISMRGLGGSRTLVLLDGVPLMDPFGGYVRWSEVPIGAVDRVEITRGGAAGLYGNYAMGGVINIITKPLDTTGVTADVSDGTFNTRRANANMSWSPNDDFGLGVNVSALRTDGFILTPPNLRTPLNIPTGVNSFSTQFQSDYHPSGGGLASLRLNVLNWDQGQGLPLGVNRQNAFTLAGRAEIPLHGPGVISANAFARYEKLNSTNPQILPGSDGMEEFVSSISRIPARDMGGSVQWVTSAGPSLPLITAGLDFRQTQGEYRLREFNSAEELTLLQKSGGHQIFGGLFVEGKVAASPRLDLLGSLRLDYFQNSDGHQVFEPGTAELFSNRTYLQLDPRLSAHYRLTSSLALRGAVYRAFRAPDLINLYRTTFFRGNVTEANPLLTPETLLGADAGLDWEVIGISGQLNLFWNQIKDETASVVLTVSPNRITQPQNVGTTRSRGVEISAKRAFGSWSARAGYTYTDASLVDNPSDRTLEGDRVPDIPRNFTSGSLMYTHSSGWIAQVQVRATSRRYEDAANKLAQDAVTLWDALISCPINNVIEIYAEGQNLFNREYIGENLSDPRLGAPREFFAGIRTRFPSSPVSR